MNYSFSFVALKSPKGDFVTLAKTETSEAPFRGLGAKQSLIIIKMANNQTTLYFPITLHFSPLTSSHAKTSSLTQPFCKLQDSYPHFADVYVYTLPFFSL